MNLPAVVSKLIDAQNKQDTKEYFKCFTENAVVKDEGKTHIGREQIREWISKANETYQSKMRPTNYDGNETSGVSTAVKGTSVNDTSGRLTTEVSGTFPGSPITLIYQFTFKNDQIDSLSITY